MTIESTIVRANKEIQSKRLWRAKEILGSSISTYEYSPELLYAFANVLLLMGDTPEAGKYFLLSVDTPTEAELDAIKIFLSRSENLSYVQLLQKFPPKARLENRDQYPVYLRNHLIETGAPSKIASICHAPKSDVNSNDCLFLVGCGLFALCTVTCALVGLVQIISWLW